jgi:hypothetical protein
MPRTSGDRWFSDKRAKLDSTHSLATRNVRNLCNADIPAVQSSMSGTPPQAPIGERGSKFKRLECAPNATHALVHQLV